jgi:squalene-hopene/tetraprenyl-beta-curcumene cyclase
MRSTNRPSPLWLAALTVALTAPPAWAANPNPATWSPDRAASYLDAREKDWFLFTAADRGEGANKTTCVSCHSMVPFALARPALRKLTGTVQPSEFEKRILDQTRKRVEHWNELDTPKYRLLYDFDAAKKKESWGTEAVMNALLLAFDDHYQGRKQPSEVTRKAFANLWKVQVTAGEQKGSWDWLEFGLEPWESRGARYFGAALAAVAVGTAPGYYQPGQDADVDAGVIRLRGYLRDRFATQNLYNQIAMLWAASRLDGFLTSEERKALVQTLFARQQADGGWSLPGLGKYVRHDGTAQATESDGLASGLVLHVLQTAGVARNDPRIGRGLAWLQTHQEATGEWRTNSVNKKRDPTKHAGKFMSDAATAYAVLALSR